MSFCAMLQSAYLPPKPRVCANGLMNFHYDESLMEPLNSHYVEDRAPRLVEETFKESVVAPL